MNYRYGRIRVLSYIDKNHPAVSLLYLTLIYDLP